MFLEIHLAISKMCERISSLHGIKLGKVVLDSEEICEIKSIKTILEENDKYELLKYILHYNALDDKEKELLDMKV